MRFGPHITRRDFLNGALLRVGLRAPAREGARRRRATGPEGR